MSEWIKEIVIAIGGGATATIAILIIFRSIVTRIVDKAIETSFEKSTIKFSNKLERTTKAYEILLKKEFDFYEKMDPYMAALVPLVQDLETGAVESQKNNSDYVKEKYRERLLKYLKMISKIKNDFVMFQPYIPENIFDAVAMLVKNMQSDLPYLDVVAEVIYEKTDGEIDASKLQEIREKVLLSVALIESRIKKRLTELSSN